MAIQEVTPAAHSGLLAPEPDFSTPVPEQAIDMTEMITRVTRDTQVRLLKAGDHVMRLVPKISALVMARISKGINADENNFNFAEILDGVRGLVHKEDRAKFDAWLEDDEPAVEDVMEFMTKAMEIITGKA